MSCNPFIFLIGVVLFSATSLFFGWMFVYMIFNSRERRRGGGERDRKIQRERRGEEGGEDTTDHVCLCFQRKNITTKHMAICKSPSFQIVEDSSKRVKKNKKRQRILTHINN